MSKSQNEAVLARQVFRPFEWHPVPARRLLAYDVAFDDAIGQLLLPRDLRQSEADRVCAMIQALVIPETKIEQITE